MADDKLAEARKTIMLLQDELEALRSPPYVAGTMLGMGEKTARVSTDAGDVYEIALTPDLKKKIKKSDRVVLNLQTKAIIGHSEFTHPTGESATVQEGVNGRVKISYKGETRVVDHNGLRTLPGDEVILDPSGNLIVELLPKTKTRYSIEAVAGATWDKLGGLESTINQIREEVELPFREPAVYAEYGRSPIKGLLLYGAPGCGKTQIARCLTNSLGTIKGLQTRFFSVKGPELLEKWVGNTESNIRGLYAGARAFTEETKGLAVIFLDEADALLRARGSGISSDVQDTIVPQFTAEMDGLTGNHNILTILATNREDAIDSAVLRDGRVDRRIKIPRPNAKGGKEILGIYLKGKPIDKRFYRSESGQVDTLAERAAEIIYADKPFYEVTAPDSSRLGYFGMKNIVSGALLKGIVDRATGYAIRDQIAKRSKGLSGEHMQAAVQDTFAELSQKGSFGALLTKGDWDDAFGERGHTYYRAWHNNALNLTLCSDSNNYKEVEKR